MRCLERFVVLFCSVYSLVDKGLAAEADAVLDVVLVRPHPGEWRRPGTLTLRTAKRRLRCRVPDALHLVARVVGLISSASAAGAEARPGSVQADPHEFGNGSLEAFLQVRRISEDAPGRVSIKDSAPVGAGQCEAEP